MQALLFPMLATLIIAAQPFDDDKINSENKASGVRPPPKDYFISMQSKNKQSEKEVLNADDVKKIEAKKDEDVIVKGTVTEVYLPKSGTIAILNFGKDIKKCFKAVVFKADFDKWDGGAEGIKKKYQGKTVTVEGKVSMYQNAPQIAVKTPSQFKVN